MRGQRRWTIGAAVAAGMAVLVYFFPLFHVVPLSESGPDSNEAAFDASAFVDQFWTERLVPGTVRAVDAAELIAAIERDRETARKKYGRSVGLGSAFYYFVRGTGRVVSVEKNSVGLSLHADQSTVQVSLQTGNIFGNAVRDGTGLLDVNNFANSQDFNALSSEINRRIEERVLPALRKRAAVGDQVRFIGCAEIMDEETDLHPLQIVPVVAEVL
jgi:predicted lipoprotein